MTPEQQRIAIAEVCGWKFDSKAHDGTPMGIKPNRMRTAGCRIPDYLNDLNAMHEAEKLLTPGPWHAYEYKLGVVTKRDGVSLIHATAAQRCEAFLKTLGKWEEKP